LLLGKAALPDLTGSTGIINRGPSASLFFLL
jgi:hypothetical protein